MPDSYGSLPTRAAALTLMQEYTASESLRKHMLSVEAAMRAYAGRFGEDPERWGLTGLIHDFDYERFPNAAQSPTEEHPSEGVRILRGLGWPEDILEAILGHGNYTGVPRTSRMAKTLFAVDELTGLITATALVKPSKSLAEVDARSVRKKMKDKTFARGVRSGGRSRRAHSVCHRRLARRLDYVHGPDRDLPRAS
jgi:predicted hydrolase (HD superfamily)